MPRLLAEEEKTHLGLAAEAAQLAKKKQEHSDHNSEAILAWVVPILLVLAVIGLIVGAMFFMMWISRLRNGGILHYGICDGYAWRCVVVFEDVCFFGGLEV